MSTTSTHTEGGAYVGGDAQPGRDFVGRNQMEHLTFDIRLPSA